MAAIKFEGVELTPEGQKYMDAINKLQKTSINIGFPEDSGTYPDGTSVAEVAAYNEFGTSIIPPRPFIQPAFEKNQDKLNEACQEALNAIAEGEEVEKALSTVGELGVTLIQDEIKNGSFAPLAPETIKAKGSDKPLIDTGLMYDSVRYTIEEESGT